MAIENLILSGWQEVDISVTRRLNLILNKTKPPCCSSNSYWRLRISSSPVDKGLTSVWPGVRGDVTTEQFLPHLLLSYSIELNNAHTHVRVCNHILMCVSMHNVKCVYQVDKLCTEGSLEGEIGTRGRVLQCLPAQCTVHSAHFWCCWAPLNFALFECSS